MASKQSIVRQQFHEWYCEAWQLYDDDKLEECIEECRKIVDDSACPRFYQVKTLVLLGSTLGDWEEAKMCCEDAEALWQATRQWYNGQWYNGQETDEDVKELLAELRKDLDELTAILDDEGLNDTDPDGNERGKAVVQAALAASQTVADMHEAEFGEENRWDEEHAWYGRFWRWEGNGN